MFSQPSLPSLVARATIDPPISLEKKSNWSSVWYTLQTRAQNIFQLMNCQMSMFHPSGKPCLGTKKKEKTSKSQPKTNLHSPPHLLRVLDLTFTDGWKAMFRFGLHDGLCVCVCRHPIYSERQTCGRASRGHTGGRSHRVSRHLLSAVRALIFLARRIQPSLSLVDREIAFWSSSFIFVSPRVAY